MCGVGSRQFRLDPERGLIAVRCGRCADAACPGFQYVDAATGEIVNIAQNVR